MGRPPKGWRIKPQPGTDILAVAWTQPGVDGARGREIQRSTGERDPTRAAKVGARKYAAAIRGEQLERTRTERISTEDLAAKGGEWLASRKDLDEETVKTYALYFDTHLGPYFKTVSGVFPDSVRAYSKKRLQTVGASTVRHELSTLRMMFRWLLPDPDEADRLVPHLSKDTRGTSYEKSTGKRRRGKPTDLDEAETLAVIAKLPEWSRRSREDGSRYPIRARFIVKYETGLREALIDQIRAPENWDPMKPGELRITPELDKMRYARPVPLTRAAQEALAAVWRSQGDGVLFGSHDYRCIVRAAARAASIPEHRVKTLAPNDLRHARATHVGASPHATLNAMMQMFGWTQPATASRYMHPSFREAERMVHAISATTPTLAAPSSPPATSTTQSSANADGGLDSDGDPPLGFG